MRIFLFILALPAGAMALASIVSAFRPGGSDIQLLAFGVFLIALVAAVTGIGVMSRLEQILGRQPRS